VPGHAPYPSLETMPEPSELERQVETVVVEPVDEAETSTGVSFLKVSLDGVPTALRQPGGPSRRDPLSGMTVRTTP